MDNRTANIAAVKSLKNRAALLTGASRGIGKCITLSLAREGANLIIVGRDKDALEKTRVDARRINDSCDPFIITADLADPKAPSRIIEKVQSRFEKLDILINNAGFAERKSIEETSVESWDKIIAVNARAPFFLCRAALPLLELSNFATIINMSSILGKKGYEYQAAYSASKHALMGFTKAMARELQDRDIRVHAISPGGVATDMIARMRPDIPQEDLISPAEIAEMVIFILQHRGNAIVDELIIRRQANVPWQ